MAIATGDPHVHHLLFDVATSSISINYVRLSEEEFRTIATNVAPYMR